MNNVSIFNLPIHMIDSVLLKFPPAELCRMRQTCKYFDNFVERNRTRFGKRIFSKDCINIEELSLFGRSAYLRVNMGNGRSETIPLEYAENFTDQFSGVGIKQVRVMTKLGNIIEEIINKLEVTERVYVEDQEKYGYTCKELVELLKTAKFPEKFEVTVFLDESIDPDDVFEAFKDFKDLREYGDRANLSLIEITVDDSICYDREVLDNITTLYEQQAHEDHIYLKENIEKFYGYIEIGTKYALIADDLTCLDIILFNKNEERLKELALEWDIPPFYEREGFRQASEQRRHEILGYYDLLHLDPLPELDHMDIMMSPYI